MIKVTVPTVLRVLSCLLWGLGGSIAVTQSPIVGILSIFSASFFLTAIVMESII